MLNQDASTLLRRARRALLLSLGAIGVACAVALHSAPAPASPAPAAHAAEPVFTTLALSAPPATPAPAATASPAPERISLARAFFIQMDSRTGRIEWLGSFIIWFLLLLSVVSIALIGALAFANRRDSVVPRRTVDDVRRLLHAGDVAGAEKRVRDDPSFFALITRAALAETAHGYDAVVRALERASDEHTTQRLRRIEALAVIGAVSPMIGLFGTVYGMILAFQEIVASGGSPDPVGLAAGIGTALVTTFWGLVVAIPALAAYAFIRNTVDGLTAEAALAAEELLSHLRKESVSVER